MKIRTGFVSNSSSSSFAIIGQRLTLKELKALTEKDIKSMDIQATTDSEGGEGEVIAVIKDKEFLDHLLRNSHIREAYNVFVECGESDVEFDVKDLPKSGKLFMFTTTADQSTPYNLQDWKEYCDYDEQDDYGEGAIPKGFVRLEMVEDGHNKFYEMKAEDGADNMYVTYGKIGSKGVTQVYPIEEWATKYKEKIKKGYEKV